MNESFKRILNQINSPLDDTTKIIDELCVSIFDDDGNIKSLKDIMKELENALEGMKQDEQGRNYSNFT